MKSQKHGEILGISIDSTPKAQLLNLVKQWLQEKKHFFIVTPNPEIVLQAHRDKTLRDILNSAEISLPDGIGLKFAAQILNQPQFLVIKGREFMEDLFSVSEREGFKIALLGGTSAVIKRSLLQIKKYYPHVEARGFVGPLLNVDGTPVDSIQSIKETQIIKEINSFKPDFLFVGFGAPKQEKWYHRNKGGLQVTGVMVVGGSLDVFSGLKKTPPVLINSLGLEWLWRVLQEPTRLGRILNAVVVFPLMVMSQKFRQ